MSWMVKRDPFTELRSIQNEFNRAFGAALPRVFGNEDGVLSGNWTPSVDIAEDENAITLEADLPGLRLCSTIMSTSASRQWVVWW